MRPLTGREKKIFVACVLTVLFSILFGYLIVPLEREADEIYQEASILQEKLDSDLKIIEEAKAFNKKYEAYLSQFFKPGTKEEATAEILSEIETVVNKLGLNVTNLKPRNRQGDPAQYNDLFSVSLTLDDTFSDMIRFLHKLQQPPYLFYVEEVEFERLSRLNDKKMIMRCVLSKPFIQMNQEAGEQREEVDKKSLPEEFMPYKPSPFNIYAQSMKERDLFEPIREKFNMDSIALKKALPALHERIKLIGILLDGDSKAIVEDLKEKQTHFLSKGESIGTVLLEDIKKDKVIFNYNDQRVEMTP